MVEGAFHPSYSKVLRGRRWKRMSGTLLRQNHFPSSLILVSFAVFLSSVNGTEGGTVGHATRGGDALSTQAARVEERGRELSALRPEVDQL
jgi:hypothetical protein